MIYKDLSGAIALGKHYLEFMFTINSQLHKRPHALIYNGIDVVEFRSHLTYPITQKKLCIEKASGEIWCIFAGTLGPSYDIQGIIECSKRCLSLGYGEYKFIIAGSGPYEEKICEAEKTQNNLLYVGKLLPEQLVPIYGKCDIGLSTYSAGSNVDMCDKFYDYTAAGLAIINSLKGEVSEHICGRNLGVNYQPNDAEDLMRALLHFKDSEVLAQTKENSYTFGMQFDKNTQNEKLHHLVCEVLEMNR